MTKEMANIITEAAKIRKDYPELSYKEAIQKAEEVIKDVKSMEKLETEYKPK